MITSLIGSYSVFIFFVWLINLLISTEPFPRLLYVYILIIKSRWFVILNIQLSVLARKPKMAVCGVNNGRFKSVEKNILSWLHSWHSQNKCATVSSFQWQMKYPGESIFPKIYSFLFKDTINPLQLFIFTNVIRCFRLPLWVGYVIYLKFTRVSSIVYQSLHR